MNQPSAIDRAALLADRFQQNLLPWLQSLALLVVRLYLLNVFFKAGLVKLQDWEATLFLFTEEYKVPVLPPELAAWAGTLGEIGFSSLVALGLFGRLAALGLFAVNLVAAVSYPGLNEAGLKDHVLWGVLAATVALFGPGKLSLDAWWWPRLLGSHRRGQP